MNVFIYECSLRLCYNREQQSCIRNAIECWLIRRTFFYQPICLNKLTFISSVQIAVLFIENRPYAATHIFRFVSNSFNRKVISLSIKIPYLFLFFFLIRQRKNYLVSHKESYQMMRKFSLFIINQSRIESREKKDGTNNTKKKIL